MIKMIPVAALCMVVAVTAGTAFSADQPRRIRAEAASSVPNAAPAVLGIIPAQSEPGRKVVMFGSGFGDRATVFLGSVEIPARVSEGKQAEFTVPAQLEPGLYALYLKRADGVIGRTYNFTVLPLRPLVSGLVPDRIISCAEGSGRDVAIQGQNFTDQSQVLLDGAVIRSRFISPEYIAFRAPQAPGGLHQVMVKNPPDISSTPIALAIDTKPEITRITVGNEYVNSYELIIEGNNFQQTSSIYVDGLRVGGQGGQSTLEQREKLIYVDCTRMIYVRYPYSPVSKDFRIHVMNASGEGSQVITVTAP